MVNTTMTLAPMTFRFLDLPAELRNRIYDFAAIDKDEPTQLMDVRNHSDSPVPSKVAKLIIYRMGLAQTCKQMRAEYLPIYAAKAHIRISSHDLSAFLDAFYQDSICGRSSPRNLTVDLCDSCVSSGLFDVLPILKIHAMNPAFECRFAPFPNCPCEHGCDGCGETFQLVTKEGCTLLNEFYKLEEKSWLAELKKGTFSKIDARYMIADGDLDVGVELSKPLEEDDPIEKDKVYNLLTSLPYAFCQLGTNEHGEYDHVVSITDW